jgi:hypothetical protein
MRALWLLLVFALLATTPHKYYVSTTDMFYKPQKHQLQLVSRVFTDDFSAALSKHAKKEIKLDPDNTPKQILDSLLGDYFKTHFVVYGLPETTTFSFVGWEYKQDQTHVYASFDSVPKAEVLEWSNAFLFAVFPDQKNIVTLSTPTHKKSFLHSKDQNFAQYRF